MIVGHNAKGRTIENGDAADGYELSRRQMGVMSVAAGVVAATGSAAAALPVTETDVQIKTPDGICDAAFIRPASGSYPGVIIWTDAFGLRPSFREMGKRLAAEGYAVLVPNPYYRTGKAPLGAGLNFNDPTDRAKLMELMGSLTQDKIERDTVAYVAFLDSQPATKKSAKIGTNGYCMGGRLTMITAATLPDRIGAGGSFHGGGLVTDKPDSPHLLVPKIKARYYFGIATNDDQQQPDAKNALRAAFAAANVPAQIEVYEGAMHGWCVPDMPAMEGKPIYDPAKAEVAWGHLLALYKTALV
ncbi:MAG: dienelactone hydrolase family protein [Rhodospirillaceae bacterium]|nr:MAG: dienelactone hydrolase family protein [Rhodospirillaceae bacterium]